MASFDDFFRAKYWPLVRYCSSFGWNPADVEEEVASTIHRHFDEYSAKITGPQPFTTLRHWMARRVLLNLTAANRKWAAQHIESGLETWDALTFDDPAEVVSLQQRLPQVPAILVNYESFRGGQRTRGLNTPKDTMDHFRAKARFLKALDGG